MDEAARLSGGADTGDAACRIDLDGRDCGCSGAVLYCDIANVDLSEQPAPTFCCACGLRMPPAKIWHLRV